MIEEIRRAKRASFTLPNSFGTFSKKSTGRYIQMTKLK